MIILDNLTYLYHHLPMRFHLSLKAGERVAVLGPSGAGKSTLLNLIAGFLRPLQGTITLNGVNHSTTAPSQRPVSILFQGNNLFAHLNVWQNIALGANPGLRLTPEQKNHLQQIVEQTGLENYLQRLPGQLSGGQRQRVALARYLLRRQPILLLDEPFSALDPALRASMLHLLDTVCQQQNLTLLMVSHNLNDAQQIAPRTLLIQDGRIYYDGDTDALVSGQAKEAEVLGIKASEGINLG